MSRRFQFSLKRLLVAVGVVALPLWYVSGYMPGTLYIDESGFPHGTGAKRYLYPSGALKLEESYYGGHLSRSRWYYPDGSLFADTTWKAGPCVGYYLRDDGSLHSKYNYVNGLAEGQAVYYNERGNVERTAMFHEGVEVKP